MIPIIFSSFVFDFGMRPADYVRTKEVTSLDYNNNHIILIHILSIERSAWNSLS